MAVTGDFLYQGYRLISGSGADFAAAVSVEEVYTGAVSTEEAFTEEAFTGAASTEAVLAEVSTGETPTREATADNRFVSPKFAEARLCPERQPQPVQTICG